MVSRRLQEPPTVEFKHVPRLKPITGLPKLSLKTFVEDKKAKQRTMKGTRWLSLPPETSSSKTAIKGTTTLTLSLEKLD